MGKADHRPALPLVSNCIAMIINPKSKNFGKLVDVRNYMGNYYSSLDKVVHHDAWRVKINGISGISEARWLLRISVAKPVFKR